MNLLDEIPPDADPIDYNRVAENLGMTHLDLERTDVPEWDTDDAEAML